MGLGVAQAFFDGGTSRSKPPVAYLRERFDQLFTGLPILAESMVSEADLRDGARGRLNRGGLLEEGERFGGGSCLARSDAMPRRFARMRWTGR